MIFGKQIFQNSILAFTVASTLAFTGCQSTSSHMGQTTPKTVTTTTHTIATGKSSLSCTGVYACEINTIGKLPIISQVTHTPSPTLSQNSSVKVEQLSTTKTQGKVNLPNYLVTFPSGQQMVATRFYLDDGLNTVESLSFIQNFESGKRYQLKAYRQIQKTDYSLLAQSAPTPLCIDLYENDKLAKKWCKKPNQQGALSNEFIKVNF